MTVVRGILRKERMLECDELTTQPGTGAENCTDGEKFKNIEENCQKDRKEGGNNIKDYNETDMFLNEEYVKMMPSQEEQCGMLAAQPGTGTDKLTTKPGTEANKLTTQPGTGTDKLDTQLGTGAEKLAAQPDIGTDKLTEQGEES